MQAWVCKKPGKGEVTGFSILGSEGSVKCWRSRKNEVRLVEAVIIKYDLKQLFGIGEVQHAIAVHQEHMVTLTAKRYDMGLRVPFKVRFMLMNLTCTYSSQCRLVNL
jgi:hypothetical protein